MTKRMLIDATHAEETRVVVLDGNRLEDFDVETSTKRQLKGNIYLAKVVRVEPSLQAAFVEYGGGRHGFLAFGEIHPDYYQIPVADRQRLLDMQAEEAREEAEEEDRAAAAAEARAGALDGDAAEGEPADRSAEPEEASAVQPATIPSEAEADVAPAESIGSQPESELEPEPEIGSSSAQPASIPHETISGPELDEAELARTEPAEPAIAVPDADAAPAETESPAQAEGEPVFAVAPTEAAAPEPQTEPTREPERVAESEASPIEAVATDAEVVEVTAEAESDVEETGETHAEPAADLPPPETVGGDGEHGDDRRDRRIPPRFLRNYKIQEVIKRRQILLVQVVKEERGTKGAALTTYLSLAGRYCVLMPNSPRGGGISRKITSAADRRRLKEITAELEIPRGMGLIVRTAGANRPKPEIKRDCEYLMRMWDDIREHTMRSVAPALIYEEASLIKRAIRDVYSRDVDEVDVDGEAGWRAARDFMRMLMPSHARKVQLWRENGQTLFSRFQVDVQLDAMLMPTVQLRSGGYLVINQTEALVSIDVNSGRSTRERGIEETALKTNLEAADEVARQLRLRDLAGLIVIDFIDMEAKKHNAMVERRLKEALKNDRARIQVGHISHFGLLEMSRQRLRPSLAETSFTPCPHCGGSGHIRSIESSAIHVLRQLEEEGAKRRSAEVICYAATPIALYILNHKRQRLSEIEVRHGLHVAFASDDSLVPPEIRIDRVRAASPSELPPAITPDAPLPVPVSEAEATEQVEEFEADEDVVAEAAPEAAPTEEAAEAGEDGEEAERRHRRRRRRRRGGRREDGTTPNSEDGAEAEQAAEPAAAAGEAAMPENAMEGVPERAGEEAAAGQEDQGEAARGRGRSRRGGRRRRRDGAEDGTSPVAVPGAEQPDLPYSGPTPANPFGGQAFDIFDLIDNADEPIHPTGGTGGEPELRPVPEPAPVLVAPEPASEPITAQEPVAAAVAEPAIAPAPPEPEPAPEPEPEPAPEPANDTAPDPALQPIIIGAEAEPVIEKKRGWWRR
ncbi:MAG: Rne/Rng family ribonuclease [Alphaproteobacteria bacterium]|nr:Rne/Rng family ribonuclease [Alphaproteobacteria bacterium]